MQLSAFLLFAVGLQVSAATYSQTVSFTGKDVPLKTVFASLKNQTGYGVFFENGEAMLQSSAPVTVDLKNVSLELFLKVCLKDQPLDYTLEGKTIFIKKKESVITVSATVADDPILQIKGRVTNDKSEPLVNANITVKRTGRGTVTDANGNFYLRNVNSDDVVSVTFIGYKTVSMPIKDRISLTVVMSATTNDLDKVVVQAYGTTSQRLATGNIGTVSAEQIARQPIMNPLEALQGQIAGVVVTNTSGYASGTVKVEIRGRNSINNNFPSDPLYIIDGVPLTILDLTGSGSYNTGSNGVIQSGIYSPATGQSPLLSLNPSDIESMEVLKDADATAIYGSRGANGVILITTKKGRQGKTHFDLSAYSGTEKTIRYYNMLSTSQYLSMRREALNNDEVPIDNYSAPDLTLWDTTRYTNWQKYLWGGVGHATDIQGSLSGGDANTTFRIGTGYHYQTDILTASGANKRGSLSFNFNHISQNRKLNIGLSSSYSIVSSDMIYTPGAISLPPNAPPIYNNKGLLNYAAWDSAGEYFPFGSLLQPYSTKSNDLNSNLLATYEIIKGLQIRASLGYNNFQTTQTYTTPIASQDPSNIPTGITSLGYTFVHNLIFEPQLEYNKFISKGKLDVLVGSSVQTNSTSSAYQNGFGFTNDALLQSVAAAPHTTTGNFSGEYKYAALFGRISYNWKNKYLLNVNMRRDGSSKFGPGHEYGNFGSVGSAWIFSEENWIKKNIPILSLGKLRGSYGITGNDQINQYAYLSEWQFSSNTYNSIPILTAQGHSDSTLHWEVNYKMEAAIDLAFLQDRITIEAAWYRNHCNDQLINFPTPIFSGFGSVISNSIANVENTGLEFQINAQIVNNKLFKWAIKSNIGLNRNRLLAYPNLTQSPYAGQYIIGKSLNITKGLHFNGVDSQTGLYSFQDKNKDGKITVDVTGQSVDDRFAYDLSPKYDGGITNTISYKNLTLSIFFYFKKQLGINAYNNLDAPGDMQNQPANVLSRWQKPGNITNTARFTTMPYAASFVYYKQYSDAVISDASFIRLQNLLVSYSIPQNLTKKTRIGNFTIYIKGENLFLITKYNGIDPETQNFGGLPKPRTVTAGLSINL